MSGRIWFLAGMAFGVGVTLAAGAVRAAIDDAVDRACDWWWDLVDTARRVLIGLALLALTVSAGWAVVALLLP